MRQSNPQSELMGVSADPIRPAMEFFKAAWASS